MKAKFLLPFALASTASALIGYPITSWWPPLAHFSNDTDQPSV